MNLAADNPLALAAVDAIRNGDVSVLKRLLKANPDLATARIADPKDSVAMSRSLLHIVTDWPGHFPNCAPTIAALVEAGTDVNARFAGPHTETPLHWAASSEDLVALDALLKAGADVEARGAVIGGGTALADAVAFGQWKAAGRLVDCGACTTLAHEAALGLMERIERRFADEAPPDRDQIDHAFWYACHGGQQGPAKYLLARDADVNWVPGWEKRTPLEAAIRSRADALVGWLRAQGAKSAADIA